MAEPSHHLFIGRGNPRKTIFLWGGVFIPVLFLEAVHVTAGESFSWYGLAGRGIFVVSLFIIFRWTQPYFVKGSSYVLPWSGVLVAAAGIAAFSIYGVCNATWAAWIMTGALYVLFLWFDMILTHRRGILWWLGVRCGLASTVGLITAVIFQLESHFADEEFFVVLQAIVLGLFWVMLLLLRTLLFSSEPVSTSGGLCFNRRWLLLLLMFFIFAGLGFVVHAYQHSFFPIQARLYKGISSRTPFLFGQAPPDSETYDGEEVFQRLLARVEANPHKKAPEYGMLALATGQKGWAQLFREKLLNEASEGRFTGPAHSVKYVQFLAALRAYYLKRVHAVFPDLFSDTDMTLLKNWFAAINRRAFTTEWVDWMYALAFAKWPEGPYENQEIGAGLLALLEWGGLSDSDLSETNRKYLERNRRGWHARFHVTDDAFYYQPLWITNAYFQSLYHGEIPEDNMRSSFEWLLLQALPDGAPMRYNHPVYSSLAGIAYLGAYLLNDPDYIWLAGRSLAELEKRGEYLYAQPGVEHPVSLIGSSPDYGSCLIYSDSGLPNQGGPLAPDKIIFRDGWSKNAAYVLLDLRFSGWHRYKATNTISMVYKGQPIVGEVLSHRPFGWLPAGRSLFRDKRIPRENLNGLLIERSGMSKVVYSLTGMGGFWAQDPSYYAEVNAFETGAEFDWSHTRLANWRGWHHDRRIYFYHRNAPIVVVDEVEGIPGNQAAIVWHVAGKGIVQGKRIRLGNSKGSAQVCFLPMDVDDGYLKINEETDGVDDSGFRILYHNSNDGRLRLVTLFLFAPWEDAKVSLQGKDSTFSLFIQREGERIILPLEKNQSISCPDSVS